MSTYQEISSFIWKVCDDELRGLFKPHEYGDVPAFCRIETLRLSPRAPQGRSSPIT